MLAQYSLNARPIQGIGQAVHQADAIIVTNPALSALIPLALLAEIEDSPIGNGATKKGGLFRSPFGFSFGE